MAGGDLVNSLILVGRRHLVDGVSRGALWVWYLIELLLAKRRRPQSRSGQVLIGGGLLHRANQKLHPVAGDNALPAVHKDGYSVLFIVVENVEMRLMYKNWKKNLKEF